MNKGTPLYKTSWTAWS